jgi:glutathione S-transferase
VIELFQAEWCPASHRVRQRLTELGVDYVVRQVPVEREERSELRATVGAETIPVLRLENGSVVVGEDRILAFLSGRFVETPFASSHGDKAASMQRRFLEEECGCADPAVRVAS